jgi:anaerobic selenocysteine-containing dehydrogenase
MLLRLYIAVMILAAMLGAAHYAHGAPCRYTGHESICDCQQSVCN